jgi:hypothetical protein
MHAKPDFARAFFCLQVYRPGSVIADVITLENAHT